jgi:hypothetical protein
MPNAVLIALSLVIACGPAYLVTVFWEEWKAAIIFLYAVYIMGARWMPTRTPLGYSISVGVAVGLLIPVAIWLIRGP